MRRKMLTTEEITQRRRDILHWLLSGRTRPRSRQKLRQKDRSFVYEWVKDYC